MVPRIRSFDKEGSLLDYLKCVVANRLLLLGYVFTVGGFALLAHVIGLQRAGSAPSSVAVGIAGVIFYAGCALLGGTAFGSHTMDSYRRARSILEGGGELTDTYLSLHSSYCRRCGSALAEREFSRRRP